MSDHDTTPENETGSGKQEQLYSGQHIDAGESKSSDGSETTAAPSAQDQIGILIEAIKKAVSICQDPQGCWKTIKTEEWTIEQLYRNFLVPLALVAGVSQLIGLVLTVKVVGAVMGTLMNIAMMLAMPFVGAIVVEKCATVFEGKIDLDNALKYLAFTYSPTFLAAMLGMFGVGWFQIITGLISLLAGLYAIYLFWEGAVPMTDIPQAKKMPFVVMVAAIMIVIAIIAATIMGFFIAL